jgi:DNA-binding CsgD family transcriptional regulator
MKKAKPQPGFPFPKREFPLTDRERVILQYYAQGKSYSGIGKVMGLSPKTVGSALQRVRQKLRATNRVELVKAAIKLGLIG